MGFWSSNDQALRDARHELDEQHYDERKALRRGDDDATERNEELQSKVAEASRNASPLARGFWG